MKLPKSSGGDMIVHLIDSPEGQAELASHGLIAYDLITAIKHFQVAEGIRVGTLIGVNEQGFFGAKREGWLPDQPDAFSEPLHGSRFWSTRQPDGRGAFTMRLAELVTSQTYAPASKALSGSSGRA